MLTFRVTNRSFKLDGDLLKPMTNHKFNVDDFNPQDKKKLRVWEERNLILNRKDDQVLETNL